jgi:DNA polymerase-1
MADELFLIDGNSLAYRAFFALPESIATSTGEPTNAIFGFASMLVKILTDYGPRATVVVWDRGHSGRREIYSEYKAQRMRRPDLLAEQWPALEPLVEAFGYHNLGVDGYEADDVIASIVERARRSEPPIEVVVVTGDRDAYQLVGDGVRIMTTSRGVTETKLYDRQGVIERYGIPPELVPDFIGLKGDSSDNIPGVPGIGEKTAAELLSRFGSLEGVLANVDQISGAKRRQNLIEHAADAVLSKQLATARRDIPLDGLDLHALLSAPPDRSRLRETFRRYELREPLRRLEEALGSADGAAPAPAAERPLHAVVQEVPLSRLAAALPAGAPVAVAIAAPSPPEGALFGDQQRPLRFGVHTRNLVLVGSCPTSAELVAALDPHPVTAHDAKSLGRVPERLAHDTEIAAYLLEPARRAYPLRELVEERGLASEVKDQAGAAAQLTAELAAWQRQQLRERGLEGLLDGVELPLVRVLFEMELAGCRIDVQRLREISAKVRDEAASIEEQIFELVGERFTLGSPKQLEEVLFTKLGLSRKRRGKTGYSTDARVLQAIRGEHPVVALIERWRELTKLAQTYLDALPLLTDQRSRIHTTFNQTAAATGRLSSNNPNLQNIPIRTPLGREIRACFIADPGNQLVCVDYSQVELRLLAHIAGEDALKEIFRRGEDVHTATACRVFGVAPEQVDARMRSKAKMVNYGIVYGLSAWGMADRLDIPQSEADEFIKRYMDGFPAVARFIEQTIQQGTEQGYVATLLGRRRQVPELRSRRWELRKQGERFAVNMVIQGTAADIIKIAMVRCHRALSDAGMDSRLILQIHDELLLEGPSDESQRALEITAAAMVGAMPEMDPPLAVEGGIGADWLSAK